MVILVEKFSDRWVRLVKFGGNVFEDGFDLYVFELWRFFKFDIVGLVVVSSNNFIYLFCVWFLRLVEFSFVLCSYLIFLKRV